VATEVYLDNNATTRPLAEVRAAMLEALGDAFGNPSSAHEAGERGREHLRIARDAVTNLIGAASGQLIFTGSGTEANAMVLGSAFARRTKARIVTTNTEHSSILKTCEHMISVGSEVVFLPVNADGVIDLDQLDAAVTPDTDLVSLQWVNNETGVVQPVRQAFENCRRKGVPFHADAAQAVGKTPIDLTKFPVDFLTLTAHKFHGPQGVGAAYARSPRQLQPLFFGGDQEYGLRAGTENVPGIVGMGKAAELRHQRFATVVKRVSKLRNEFEKRICELLPDVRINGQAASRVCNTSNLLFVGIDGQALVAHLDQDGIRCSQSSACTNQRPEPSYVLRAMGLSEEEAFASVRFGFSEENTEQEIGYVTERMVKHCLRLRQFRRQFFPTSQLTGEIS